MMENIFEIQKDLVDGKNLVSTKSFFVEAYSFPTSSYNVHHTDKLREEVYICMKGEVTFKVGPQPITMKPGDIIKIPKGVTHGGIKCTPNSILIVIKETLQGKLKREEDKI